MRVTNSDVYRVLQYIPLLNTFTACVNAIAKACLSKQTPQVNSQPSEYTTFLQQHSYDKIALTAIPILGCFFAYKQNEDILSTQASELDVNAIENIPEWDRYRVVYAAVEKNPSVYAQLPTEYKKDLDIILLALSKDGMLLEHVPLPNEKPCSIDEVPYTINRKIALVAIKQNPFAIIHVKKHLYFTTEEISRTFEGILKKFNEIKDSKSLKAEEKNEFYSQWTLPLLERCHDEVVHYYTLPENLFKFLYTENALTDDILKIYLERKNVFVANIIISRDKTDEFIERCIRLNPNFLNLEKGDYRSWLRSDVTTIHTKKIKILDVYFESIKSHSPTSYPYLDRLDLNSVYSYFKENPTRLNEVWTGLSPELKNFILDKFSRRDISPNVITDPVLRSDYENKLKLIKNKNKAHTIKNQMSY